MEQMAPLSICEADMSNWLEVLPAVGTFLAGPAGGIVGSGVQWLAEKFGASEKTVEGIKQTLSGMTPEQLLKAKEIDIEFQKFCLQNQIQLQLGQLKINEEEAKSTNWFVAGWRPGAGWVGVIALGYVAILEPIARFVAQVWIGYSGGFPVIDTALTMQVLLGLLGLGAARTVEKVRDSEGNR